MRNSKLLSHSGVSSMSRYVLTDKKGAITDLNALRPSDLRVHPEVDAVLKEGGKL